MAEILRNLFTIENFIMLNIGLSAGIIVGALPGLTGTMAIALLLPVTYGMSPVPSMILLLGVYCGGIYGGSITAILINTPGTPASAATSLDGYPMAKSGRPKRALHLALSASLFGGIFSVIVLMVASPMIARFALKFGPPEYFALAVFGLTIISGVGGNSLTKGLLMGLTGLLISSIGLDPITGIDRFNFGITSLTAGVGIIPALIGLFAVTEIMAKIQEVDVLSGEKIKLGKEPNYRWLDIAKYKITLLKSSVIGTFIGAVPGTGAAISSFLSYNEAQRTSKTPHLFGTGCEEGIVAPEAANNAVTGAALIPLLTLGIPGDTNTAVLLGALTMQGIIPGPKLFVEQKTWVYTIMLALILINLFMYLQGKIFVKVFANVNKVPNKVMIPILVMLCVIGAYAVRMSTFDVVLMVCLGFLGYGLKKLDFQLTPMVIGIVLGPLCESNLRRSLIMANGSPSIFFTRPISLIFLSLAVIMAFFSIYRSVCKKTIIH